MKNPHNNLFEILNISGRKAYWSQGYYGQDVIVADIDSGIFKEHQEFEDRVLEGKCFIQEHDQSDYTDDAGHGTITAGLIVGNTIGVAPKAKILPLKVHSKDHKPYLDEVAEAMEYIRTYRTPDGKKVDIVNLSISCDSIYGGIHEAIQELEKENILVICSSGNSGRHDIKYPAAFKETIAVGAVDLEKKICDFSSYGDYVDVCQLGRNALCASRRDTNEYTLADGTSVATPIVTGIAALLICKYKSLFGKRMHINLLRETLRMNTKDLGLLGFDKYYGFGFCTLQPLVSTMEFTIDNKEMKLNSECVQMEAPAKIEKGRTLIPLRYANDGACVLWLDIERKVKIIY